MGVGVGVGVGVLPLMCGQPSYEGGGESTPESTHAYGRCGDWAAAEVMR